MVRRLTIEEKNELVLLVGDNARSYREAAAEFNARHPEQFFPVRHKLVANIMNNFKNTGNVRKLRQKKYDLENRQYPDEERILQYFRQHPKSSVRQAAVNLNVSKDRVWRCLKKK